MFTFHYVSFLISYFSVKLYSESYTMIFFTVYFFALKSSLKSIYFIYVSHNCIMYTNDFWIKHIEFEFEFEMLKNNHFVDNIVKTSNSIEYLTELYKTKRKLRLCLVTLQTCGFFFVLIYQRNLKSEPFTSTEIFS